MANGKPWHELEDAAIVRFYPEQGAVGVRLLLPHRSLKAIQQRACVLGAACERAGFLRAEGGRKRAPSVQQYAIKITPVIQANRPHRGVGEWEGRAMDLPASSVWDLAK